MNNYFDDIYQEPASSILSNNFFKYIREQYPKYGIDYNKLISTAKQQDYELFTKTVNVEVEDNCERMFNLFRKKHGDNEYYLRTEMDNVCNSLDAIYSYLNYPKFIYNSNYNSIYELLSDLPLPAAVDAYDFGDYFNEIDDLILNFGLKSGYANLMMRICRPDYKTDCRHGDNLDTLVVVLLSNDDIKSRVVGQMTLVDGVYPNLFIDPTCTIYNCNPPNCKRRVVSSLISHTDEYYLKKNFCYMTKKKIREGACLISGFNPYKLLKIAAYVWDTYTHRHTLTRKNSKRKDSYNRNKVSIINEYTDNKVLPLHNYYKYEREHKDWQGGHHQSPIKHERRSHERRIYNKDGTLKKVVTVRQCTVNPDGRQGIYKINEPRRE